MEDENYKYYYMTKKPLEKIWINPIRGYYSYSSGVWSFIVRRSKKHKNLDKKIVVKTLKNEVVTTIIVTNADIKDYKKNHLKFFQRNNMTMKKDGIKEYTYLFEIKKVQITQANIQIIKWESPVNGVFYNALDAWGFIIRNKEKYQDNDKRLKTMDEDGKEIFCTAVEDDLIESMESDRFIVGR